MLGQNKTITNTVYKQCALRIPVSYARINQQAHCHMLLTPPFRFNITVSLVKCSVCFDVLRKWVDEFTGKTWFESDRKKTNYPDIQILPYPIPCPKVPQSTHLPTPAQIGKSMFFSWTCMQIKSVDFKRKSSDQKAIH